MSINPCTLTKAAQQKLASLGADYEVIQKKMDDLAKQANSSFELMDMPAARNAIQNFNNALSATVAGSVGELSQALAATIGESASVINGVLSVVLLLASSGTQVQLLFVSQLKRQLSIRVTLFRLLQYHYMNIIKVLNILQIPRGVSYSKLLAALPYVRKAETQFGKVVLAQSVNGLPARYSYNSLRLAFDNVQMAVNILTADSSAGGVLLGKTLEAQFGGTPTTKQRQATVAQQIAKDLLAKSVLQSLSYIETLTWNYMRITSVLPIPFEVSNAIFKPVNYVDQYMRANGITNPGAKTFNSDAEDAALRQFREAELNSRNVPFIKTATQTIEALDLLKGIIPTTVVIDSLISAIIDFPTFNVQLQAMTSSFITLLMPLVNTVQNVKEGMQDSLDQRDDDLVLTAKEAVWTGTLNTLLGLKDGVLMTSQGQAAINQDAHSLDSLVTYLIANQGSFVIAEKIPDFVSQSISVLSAPFSQRALQESLVLATFIVKQLNSAIQQDIALLNQCLLMSEPFGQFTQLLNAASKLPEPISTIANALKSGQAQEVLGFITAISLGTVDELKSLFTSNCPEVKSTEEIELKNSDSRIDSINTYRGVGSGAGAGIGSNMIGQF
jgi:hypothetical protein